MFGFIGAAIGAVVSTAVGVVSSIAATVGSAVASVARSLISIAPRMEELDLISKIITAIGRILGILPPEENVDDIGAKTMQEGTRPRMPEETAEEYLDYLRNEVELDKEKLAKMSEAEKMACLATGSAIVMEAAAEKSDVVLTPTYVVNASRAGLEAAAVLAIAHKFKENNIDIDKFGAFFNNELSGKDVSVVYQSLKDGVGNIHPEMSDKEIRAEINKMEQGILEHNSNGIRENS